MLERLKDGNRKEKLETINVLEAQRDKTSIWPLIVTAANDDDPIVREAAALATIAVAVGPGEHIYVERLSQREAHVSLNMVEWPDAVRYIVAEAHIRMSYIGIDWYSTPKVSIEMENVTLAEVLCRILAAAGTPLTLTKEGERGLEMRPSAKDEREAVEK